MFYEWRILKSIEEHNINPIRDGEVGKEIPPSSFFAVTSTNLGIIPQNFLTLSFDPSVALE